MPSRIREKLKTENFEIGHQYTRAEIAELGGVAPLDSTREWTGVVEFENCVILFPTLDKTDLPPEHRYLDVFEGDQFKWDSQNRNTQKSPVMVRILSTATPILLFCRLRGKDSGRPVPFTYAGRLEAVRARGQHPVSVLFDVLDYQQNPNRTLAELYDWRPMAQRKLEPVELPEDRSQRGQGRQTDRRKRDAIEAWAMSRAREHFEALGYSLNDTSKTSPYDYLACKQAEQRRIEVKGLTGCLGPVVVTAGEVQSARDRRVPTDLAIVHDIELLETFPGIFQGRGGEVHVIPQWVPEDSRLRPLQYQYEPPLKERAVKWVAPGR